ncbi:sodium/proline symporter PutP [Porphyrobacter sp. GA68]|uniref:sodium/proline symporter PutP n=1 Tax=Porphyrobacter sp. GA68 TaxID=2883480 RepID=UPI001D18AD32|nr:sodium/proline symporter PutP [Porphyrobacter sp. GA68]
MQTGTVITLGLYFALMIAIGVFAQRRGTADSAGYLLAGRNLPPAVAALSAGASDMSGWLLLGLPGALYAAGLVEAWIGIGLFVGALINWIVVAPRLRTQTQELGDALTIPQFLANRFPEKALALRLVSALVIVLFFTVYTAAGLVGGGKLFATSFAGLFAGWAVSPYMAGIVITATVVVAYTMIGGFLAVSLTDFVQGMIMLLALVLMPLVVMFGEGGRSGASVVELGPSFLSFTEGLTLIGWLSAVSWGLGYFGQPHIIVRFMAIRSLRDVATARWIGMSWMAVCLAGAIGVGLTGRAYVERNGLTLADPETIFIFLADTLFHPFVTGFLLAALLAAIMSTVSSQLLVSSSSLTEDFYRLFLRRGASERELVMVSRGGVLLVALAAILVAGDPDSQVLGLVANAWAGFGAAFGPMILLALTWRGTTGAGALAGLVTGAAVVGGWIALGWNASFLGGAGVYEIIPGFAASAAAVVLVSLATGRSRPVSQA